MSARGMRDAIKSTGTPRILAIMRRLLAVVVACGGLAAVVAVATPGVVGATNAWSTATDINGQYAIVAVSCPSSSFCAAVGAQGNAFTYNGTSWSAATDID